VFGVNGSGSLQRSESSADNANVARVGRKAASGLASLLALGSASNLSGAEHLRMQVSPPVSRAPGFVVIRVGVEKAADNRRLQIITESADFYRSSEIPLDGQNAPAVNVFEYRDLPTGLYHITGVLIGTRGERATVARLAKVEPAVGGR